jgi:hypothetical protein
MPFAESYKVSGTFTLGSSFPQSVNVNCGFLPSSVTLIDTTQFGTGSSAFLQSATWNSLVPANTNVTYAASASTLFNNLVTTNGISLYDGHNSVLLGAQITGTTITKANPAVATATAHGLQTGQQVIFTNNATMKQLGGLIFTVTVTGANTFTIPINTNTANFTQETAFKVAPVSVGPLYYPQTSTITGITAASSMVITTAINHGLTVGQQVRIRVPSVFGMTQANNLQGLITAVSTTTVTVNINSTAFTAFAWPAVTSIPFSPPQLIPIGSGPALVANGLWYSDTLDDATENTAFQGFTVGTNILQTTGTFIVAASDVIYWEATRFDI